VTVHARRVEIGQLTATHGICGIEVDRASDLSNTLHEINCGACVAALIAPDRKWVHVIAGYRRADEPKPKIEVLNKPGQGMDQATARRRAHDLGGIAVGARWKGDHWLLGGWAAQPDEVWIVVNIDKTAVLEAGEQLPVDRRDAQTRAADRLEELTAEMKALVVELREGTPDAYKKAYELRRELGYVIATLGEGVPR
jgi:hypothetical protein